MTGLRMRRTAMAAAALLLAVTACGTPEPGRTEAAGHPPVLSPDYAGVTVPPNIAPMNFSIREKGDAYRVEIAGSKDPFLLTLRSRRSGVRIPAGAWRRLLEANRGGEIALTVTARDSSGAWRVFDPVVNRVSAEPVDGFLVYRKMAPIFVFWKRMGIFERNLSNFEERTLLSNRPLNDGCFNCHSFSGRDPERWLVHLRGAPRTGMLLNTGGRSVFVNTQTEFNKAPAAYPAWHPGGRFIAFATIKVKQFFHTAGENRDVYDLASDLILFDADSNTVTAPPALTDPGRLETYPAWAPDGRTLYFCSTASFDTTLFFERHTFEKIRYDLMKVPFDPETGAFGEPQTVLAAAKTGLSATHPRVSPDGRFLMFCLCEYGNFSIYRPGSDLYLMDLADGSFRRLEVNSDRSESYHSWSGGGRWFVFSSKREDGIHARPYFARVNDDGTVTRPFVLPQEDPAYYESCLRTFNVPEFVSGPVPHSARILLDAALDQDKAVQAKYSGPKPAPSPESGPADGSWRPAPKR